MKTFSGIISNTEVNLIKVKVFPFIILQALEVTVWREGMEYEQKYSRGKPVTTLTCHVLPKESKDSQGTRIRFWPDKEGCSLTLILHFCIILYNSLRD